MEYGNKVAYVVSKQKYNMDEISKLNLYLNSIGIGTGSAVKITFGLVEEKDSNDFVAKSEIEVTYTTKKLNVPVDVIDIKGEYYIKFVFARTAGAQQCYVSGGHGITGEPK